MSIEEKMQHLTDWVNGRMIINLEYKHDFIVRDVSPHPYVTNATSSPMMKRL